jgi:predicted amidohydrolase YtcJ
MVHPTCEADLALVNGKILTVDDEFTVVEALTVKCGVIQFTGSTSEAEQFIGDSTQVVDLEGKNALPGLYDSHVHMKGVGSALKIINVMTPPVHSIEGIKKVVSDKINESKPGDWILGRGWDQVKLAEHRNPTRWDLDEIAPDNPVALTRTCGHVLLVNSYALNLAGITKETMSPEGGVIDKDDSGEPNGLLEEGPAMNLVRNLMPIEDIPEKMDCIKLACRALNSAGITSVQEPGLNSDDFVAYQNVMDEGELTVRVNLMLSGSQRNEPLEESLTRIREFPMITGYGNDTLRFMGLKLLVDGGVGGRTAFLREHYEGDPNDRGVSIYTDEKLQALVDEANKRGMLTAIHCAGGAAIDQVMNVYEKTDELKPIKGRRFQIIHVYQPSDENIEQIKRLGVTVNTQPSHVYYLGDSFDENLGRKRASWTKPHRRFLDEGICVGASTDAPVVPYPAFPSIWAGVARRTQINDTVLGIDQAVTREESLRMYTINCAYMSFEDDRKGSLEPGKIADMIVIDRDYLECPEDDIRDTMVLATYLGGKVVYKA